MRAVHSWSAAHLSLPPASKAASAERNDRLCCYEPHLPGGQTGRHSPLHQTKTNPGALQPLTTPASAAILARFPTLHDTTTDVAEIFRPCSNRFAKGQHRLQEKKRAARREKKKKDTHVRSSVGHPHQNQSMYYVVVGARGPISWQVLRASINPCPRDAR